MRSRYFIIIILFSLIMPASATDKTDQKPSITSQLLELRGELSQASSRIAQLRKDKQAIEQSFKGLEDWAVEQQKEKIEVYEENQQVKNLLSSAEQRVVNEKVEHKKTADKYHTVKSVMGYLAGALSALLYMRIGGAIFSSLISAAGLWGPIIQLLGPVGAFAAGYMFIKFYF
jgi:septal ring factor EnvC (AmiA/AmiB activator)